MATHGRKAGRQPPLGSHAPTNVAPNRAFKHRMRSHGFDIGHMPHPLATTASDRKDQLHVGRIDLLMPGDADSPAETECTQRQPERSR